MKLFTTAAALGLAIALAAPAVAQQAASQQPAAGAQIKLSKKASKAIIELQTAVQNNDTANIPAKLQAAQAVAETAEDRYAIARLQLNAAKAAKNSEAEVVAIDAIAASNYLPKAQIAGLYNSLGVDFFNAKNSARAAAMFQKALAVDPNNAESLRLLAETQNASGNKQDAVASFQRALQQAAATGQKLPEESFKRAVTLAYEAKLPEAVALSRQWAQAYPSPESWRNAIAIYRNLMRPDGQAQLDVLRLARVTNSLGGTGDYNIYAYELGNTNNYGEAKAVIDEAIASGKIKANDPVVAEIVRAIKTKPIETDAQLAQAASAAASANAMMRVGDRYYGRGNYAKAVELYRQALARPDGDKDLANLRIGMALARAGDKAGATAALNSVTGARAEVAKFWLAYLATRG